MEHVGIVVDDLAAAKAFFAELGLKLQGEGQVEAVGWTVCWGSRASGRHVREAQRSAWQLFRCHSARVRRLPGTVV